jgi:ankyrin repeat protein
MISEAVFDAAADAVVNGDEAALRALLAQHPDLIRARSPRHGAGLLHYISANGVENARQKTPANAVAITRLLLAAGADPNAQADFYSRPSTTLYLLVSSGHPHQAGLQAELANCLLDAGAEADDALLTALAFGYGDTAESLARRLPVDTLPVAAGLGRLDVFDNALNQAPGDVRHQALALAALHGRIAVLERLVAAGEDLNRLNPMGFHGHATPLHLAVWKGHEDAVRWLVGHGARIDIPDAIHFGTPLGWARHEGQAAIARYLESRTV